MEISSSSRKDQKITPQSRCSETIRINCILNQCHAHIQNPEILPNKITRQRPGPLQPLQYLGLIPSGLFLRGTSPIFPLLDMAVDYQRYNKQDRQRKRHPKQNLTRNQLDTVYVKDPTLVVPLYLVRVRPRLVGWRGQIPIKSHTWQPEQKDAPNEDLCIFWKSICH